MNALRLSLEWPILLHMFASSLEDVTGRVENRDVEAAGAPGTPGGATEVWDRVVAARDGLKAVMAVLEPAAVATDDAPVLWGVFDEVERLVAAGKLLMAARVDDSQIAKAAGFRDTAEYLARQAGCSKNTASRQLRAAKRLRDLPATEAAVRNGELSTDQASAIADAATADPEAERGLLTMAGRVSQRELLDACLRIKAKADPDPERTRKRQQRDRFLRHGRRPDGTFSLYGQGPPEDQGLLQAALRHGVEDRFRAKTGDDDGELESYEQRAYDALFDILRTHILEGPFDDLPGDRRSHDGGCDASTDRTVPEDTAWGASNGRTDSGLPVDDQRVSGLAGLPGDAPDRSQAAGPGGQPRHPAPGEGSLTGAGRRRKRRRRKPNASYTTLIRVDIEALVRGWQEGDEVCDMPGLGPVSVPAVRALLSESIIRLVLTRGEEVATVVYAGRGPSTAQKMALNWMQPVCTVEGCSSQIVQADHRIDWATTHRTTLAELDHLCPHHHGLKTRKNWALVAGTGKRAFVSPIDPRHPGRQSDPETGEPSRSTAA